MRELEFYKLKTGNNNSLKIKEIRKLKREKKKKETTSNKEYQLIFGSVWGIEDRIVIFDNKRKEEHFKDTLRPCLALESPSDFNEYSIINIAPGTTSYFHSDIDKGKILTASVPPEDLDRTTHFKIYFSQYLLQKNLQKKFCDISATLRIKLEEILNG